MELTDRGAAFIANFEGFRSCPYWDVNAWAIGYGSRQGVRENTPCITRTEARARLQKEVGEKYGPIVDKLDLDENQNHFDALVSFIYNLGPAAIEPSTGIGQALRAKDWPKAADEMLKWDKVEGEVWPGLTSRRRQERALFLRVAYTDEEQEKLARIKQPGPNPAARAWLERQAVKIKAAARQPDGTNDWQMRDRGRRYQGIRRALARYR